jgi:HD-like signal output (HDOD) protein/CheY-like chemotaxis protein
MTSATVVIVDDEPELLAALRRLLRLARPRWRTLLATTGRQAFDIVAENPVDAIVTDIRMPDMDGWELLDGVRRQFPDVTRIVFTGHTDVAGVARALSGAHQLLSKPCRHEVVIGALDRGLSQRRLISDVRVRRLLAGVAALPRPGRIVQDLRAASVQPDGCDDVSADDALARVIETDLASCADVLRMAYSPFFDLPSGVESISQAVRLLGADTVRTVLLRLCGQAETTCDLLERQHLSTRATRTASAARDQARSRGWPAETACDTFAAGLLHQIGMLVQSDTLARQPGVATPPSGARVQVATPERIGDGATAAGSSYLLSLWGFPHPVVDAVADQARGPDGPPPSPVGDLLSRVRSDI